MWGKLETIGAGRIPFVVVAADRTIMSAMRIRGIFAPSWLVVAILPDATWGSDSPRGMRGGKHG
jgi:hypothetical protein